MSPPWLYASSVKSKTENIHFCLKTLKSVNPGNFPPVDTRKQKQDGFVRYLSRKGRKKKVKENSVVATLIDYSRRKKRFSRGKK